mgnify:CR=1 FL=1
MLKALLSIPLLALALPALAADLEVFVLDREGKPLKDAVVVLESSAPGARPAGGPPPEQA